MRDLGDGVCEMKRIYVADTARGKGVGWALVAQLIAEARSAGDGVMRLTRACISQKPWRSMSSPAFAAPNLTMACRMI